MGSNSTIATNIIYDHTVQIAIHTLSNRNRKQHCLWGEIGIELRDKSSDNTVNNNTINNTQYGIYWMPDRKTNFILTASITHLSVQYL
jgi:parallel beta-helix repeat protein